MAIPETGQLIFAVFTALNNDSTLTTMLSTYDPGAGSIPCIFSGQRVPSNSSFPCVIIRPISGRQPSDTVNSRGVSFSFNIGCYSDDLESTIELNSIVDRVVFLLHRNKLTLTTDDVISATNTGIVPAETDDNLTGAMLSFNYLITEA